MNVKVDGESTSRAGGFPSDSLSRASRARSQMLTRTGPLTISWLIHLQTGTEEDGRVITASRVWSPALPLPSIFNTSLQFSNQCVGTTSKVLSASWGIHQLCMNIWAISTRRDPVEGQGLNSHIPKGCSVAQANTWPSAHTLECGCHYARWFPSLQPLLKGTQHPRVCWALRLVLIGDIVHSQVE